MNPDAPIRYRERLWPGPLGWSLAVATLAVAVVTVSPLGTVAMVVAGLVAIALVAAGVGLVAATVSVVGDRLVAGRAQIEVAWLGDVVVLGRDGVRAALGPGSDARDFALVRSWLPSALLVEITDPSDPTPRWLVSTRDPAGLAAAIEQAQAAHSEQIG